MSTTMDNDDMLDRYFDGELSDTEQEVFFQRLASDPTLRAEFTLGSSIRTTLRSKLEEPPPQLRQRLMEAVSNQATSSSPASQALRSSVWRAGFVSAIVSCVCTSAVFLALGTSLPAYGPGTEASNDFSPSRNLGDKHQALQTERAATVMSSATGLTAHETTVHTNSTPLLSSQSTETQPVATSHLQRSTTRAFTDAQHRTHGGGLHAHPEKHASSFGEFSRNKHRSTDLASFCAADRHSPSTTSVLYPATTLLNAGQYDHALLSRSRSATRGFLLSNGSEGLFNLKSGTDVEEPMPTHPAPDRHTSVSPTVSSVVDNQTSSHNIGASLATSNSNAKQAAQESQALDFSAGPHLHRFDLRMFFMRSYPSIDLAGLITPPVNNIALRYTRRVGGGHSLGVELGQETLLQEYTNTTSSSVEHIRQNYLALWMACTYDYTFDSIREDYGLTPFAQLSAGATILGPMGRIALGMRASISSSCMFNLALEGSSFFYKQNSDRFSTQKLGLSTGFSIGF